MKKSQTQPQKHLTLLKSEAGANSGVFLMPDHRLKAMFYFAWAFVDRKSPEFREFSSLITLAHIYHCAIVAKTNLIFHTLLEFFLTPCFILSIPGKEEGNSGIYRT